MAPNAPVTIAPGPSLDTYLGADDGGRATTIPISSMRHCIDEIDATILKLWQERAGLSRQRVAAGGTRPAAMRYVRCRGGPAWASSRAHGAVEDHDAAGGAFFAAMEAAPPARSRADRLDESFGVGDHVVDRVPPGWYVGGWDTPVVEGDRLIARGGQGRVWCRVQTRPAAEEPMMRNTRSPRDADFPDWAGRDLATLGYTAQMLARDGAASIDVLNRQLPLIQRPPALVTITMGATICWPHAERLVQAVTLRSPR